MGENDKAIVGSIVAIAGVVVAILSYNHTVERDRLEGLRKAQENQLQEQQERQRQVKDSIDRVTKYEELVQSQISNENATLANLGDAFYTLQFKNDCDEQVRACVCYKDVTGHWITKGWYAVGPKQTISTECRTRNRIAYYFARSDSHTWGGDNTDDGMQLQTSRNKFIFIDGLESYYQNTQNQKKFRKWAIEDNGTYRSVSLTFTCDSATPSSP